MSVRVRPFRVKVATPNSSMKLEWATTYATLEAARKATTRLPSGAKYVIEKQETTHGKRTLVESGEKL